MKDFGEGERAAWPSSPDPNFDAGRDSAQDWSAIARPLSDSPPPPGMLHGRFYTRSAVVLPRMPLIMSAAAQAKILDRALAPHRPRDHVVEL